MVKYYITISCKQNLYDFVFNKFHPLALRKRIYILLFAVGIKVAFLPSNCYGFKDNLCVMNVTYYFLFLRKQL